MYDLNRIAYELELTSQGKGYYGNSLLVAKDIPFMNEEDQIILTSWLSGHACSSPKNTLTFKLGLQNIANKIREESKRK